MSSTLVETVSINYEDFNESFLTCSTCLCTYDGGEHMPKLLCCSHTVCLHCLIRIAQSANSRNSRNESSRGDTPETFRCPICRETIQVPRGGVAALPPSFLVNQLLDLMARQRREVIPKCSIHPSQELLFCESCDIVFCSHCTAGSHGNVSSGEKETLIIGNSSITDHTVVPFSIAIKRMSEILLYKSNEIAAKLVQAEDNVSSELQRLEQSKAEALQRVEDAYGGLEKCLRRAKEDALEAVNQLASRKSQMLLEQLDLIRSEKRLVERDVSGLQYQIEVRSLSDRIAALQDKLESVSAISEPRENSFLVYELHQSSSDSLAVLERQLEHLVCDVGRPRSSTALPSLCRLMLSGSSGGMKMSDYRQLASHHGVCGRIEMVDYHGCPMHVGGDPVKVTIETDELPLKECTVIDLENGTYRFWFRPPRAGTYRIRATLFDRPLKNSPLFVEAVDYHKPIHSCGSKGGEDDQFVQPSGLAVWNPCSDNDHSDCTVYVLDSGNQRIAKYSQGLDFIGYLSSPAVEGRSATGMCISPSGSSLWVANWKTRSVMEVSVDDGRIQRTAGLSFLKEPVDVAINSKGHLLIADAAQSTVFVVAPSSSDTAESTVVCQCGSVGSHEGQFPENNLRAVTSAANDDIVAADCSRIQIFSNNGKYLRTLPIVLSKGHFGGVTYDGFGHLLVSYVENAKNKGSRCGVYVVRYNTGEVLFSFDSSSSHLKRPGRLCCASFNLETRQQLLRSAGKAVDDVIEASQANYIYVADVGDDSVKQYRYR